MCVLRDVHFLPNKTTPTFKLTEGKCQSLPVEFLLSFIWGSFRDAVCFFPHKDSQLDCLGKANDMLRRLGRWFHKKPGFTETGNVEMIPPKGVFRGTFFSGAVVVSGRAIHCNSMCFFLL